MTALSQEHVRKIISQGGKALVDAAESLGPQLAKAGLTTSQIRNVYGMVKRMELREPFDSEEFILLKPKLAYAAARVDKNKGGDGARELKTVLSWAIDEVGTDQERFKRFVNFFEAILAYHKAAGGRDR